MNNRVGIFMRVYRNEPGMHDAVKSVLAQTYSEWKYYILVNEKTKADMLRYAQNDARIVVWDGTADDGFRNRAKAIAEDGNDYLMTLDADDCLTPECLEKLVEFAAAYRTDVTVGAFEFVNTSGEVVEKRGYPKRMLFECKDFNRGMPYIYGQFRAIWGKLYSADMIRNFSMERLPATSEYGGYGGDTIFVFNLLYEANKIGIIPDTVYRYRISSTGGSHTLAEGRLKSDVLLFSFVKKFLEERSVYDEPEARFLFAVYGNAVNDTLRLLLEANITDEERNKSIHQVLSHTLTALLLVRDEAGMIFGEKTSFVQMFMKMLWSNPEFTPEYEDYLLVCANKKKLLTKEEYSLLVRWDGGVYGFYFGERMTYQINLIRMFVRMEYSSGKVMLRIIEKYNEEVLLGSLLKKDEFVKKYAELLILVLKEKYTDAMQEVRETVLTGNDVIFEELFELWSNLAAVTEDGNEYVFAREVMTETFWKQGKREKAKGLLQELLDLGVHDDNTEYLKNLISIENE